MFRMDLPECLWGKSQWEERTSKAEQNPFWGVNELGLGGVCPVSIPSSTQQQFGSFLNAESLGFSFFFWLEKMACLNLFFRKGFGV